MEKDADKITAAAATGADPDVAADAPPESAVERSAPSDERLLKPRERNVNLDLLKVFAVLFIVIHHLTINNIGVDGVTFSFIADGAIPGGALTTVLVSEFIDAFVIIGVNIFFLISGYFSIHFKLSKVFSLLVKVYVYFCVGELIAYMQSQGAWIATCEEVARYVLSQTYSREEARNDEMA